MVGGVAKLFVGELVEAARDIAQELGANPQEPLAPEYLREASRRLRSSAATSFSRFKTQPLL